MKIINNLFGLNNRIALVTGASSGLGVIFARGLAAAGAKVVIAARRNDRLETLLNELTANGNEALAIVCDVTNEDQVDALVQETLGRFNRIDILVNSAGTTNTAPAEDESKISFQYVLDVNVTASFLCAQRCARFMLNAGYGSIINIASVMGFLGIGVIPQAAYNASKGAVINLTRELAAQWAKRGVRVNAIAPGWFPTEMTEELFSQDSGEAFIKRRTPLGRSGRPEELVGTLLLLASDASSYITGQTIIVDGGWSII